MGKSGMFRVSNGRMPAFCWQEKAALRLIRKSFKPSEVATALAVYLSLTELSSNQQSDEFKVKRQTIGEMVGRSGNILDGYLNRLAELGFIEKQAYTIDNEYRGMVIRLVPSPTGRGAMSICPLPTGEVSLPTGTPSGAHRDTPPCPQGNEEEESSTKKNLTSESAGSPSAPPPRVPPPSTAHGDAPPPTPVPVAPRPPDEGADRPHSGPVVPGIVTDHESHLNPDQEDKIRRRDRERHREEEAARKKKTREEQARLAAERREDRQDERKFHADRKPEEWTAYDALHYFIARHRKKWPNETAPGITEPKDPAAVRFRFLWLKGEKQSPSVMKEVIDYIFDNWDAGIPERFKWGARPGFPLIETGSIFERLISEIRHGIPGDKKDPKRKIDSWNPEKAKNEPKISGRKLL